MVWEGPLLEMRTWNNDYLESTYYRQNRKNILKVCYWWSFLKGLNFEVDVPKKYHMSIESFLRYSHASHDAKEKQISSQITGTWNNVGQFLQQSAPCVLDAAHKIRFHVSDCVIEVDGLELRNSYFGRDDKFFQKKLQTFFTAFDY